MREHEKSRECWCYPLVVDEDENGDAIVIHNREKEGYEGATEGWGSEGSQSYAQAVRQEEG